jgi:hypothetical protein
MSDTVRGNRQLSTRSPHIPQIRGIFFRTQVVVETRAKGVWGSA